MAAKRDKGSLDSFNYVQALKHATGRAQNAPGRASAPAAPRAQQNAAAKPAPAAPNAAPPASRSAVPARRLVACYRCGYTHTAQGRISVTYCPKCRTVLETGDILIKGSHEGDALTTGDVTIARGAAFADGAKVSGRIVRVGADVSNLGKLTASEALSLLGGARLGGVEVENLGGKTLVPAGERVGVEGGLACEELDLAGALRAEVRAARGAVLRAGCVLCGSYAGPRIEIEDGAGISAQMRIIPAPR